MATVTITGTVTDSLGATGSFSTVVTLTATSSLNLSAVVTPATAPAGTARNLTVTAAGGTAPYSFATPTGTGLTFTLITGQPGQWTFVY